MIAFGTREHLGFYVIGFRPAVAATQSLIDAAPAPAWCFTSRTKRCQALRHYFRILGDNRHPCRVHMAAHIGLRPRQAIAGTFARFLKSAFQYVCRLDALEHNSPVIPQMRADDQGMGREPCRGGKLPQLVQRCSFLHAIVCFVTYLSYMEVEALAAIDEIQNLDVSWQERNEGMGAEASFARQPEFRSGQGLQASCALPPYAIKCRTFALDFAGKRTQCVNIDRIFQNTRAERRPQRRRDGRRFSMLGH